MKAPQTPAEITAYELERIRKKHGGQLTATAVLSAAADETSPLYPQFEWDDTAAAREHRLWQARQLIRSVTIRSVETGESEPRYVHIRPVKREEGYYRPIEAIHESPDEYMRALSEAQRRVESAEAAVQALRRRSGDKGEEATAVLVLALEALKTASTALAKVH